MKPSTTALIISTFKSAARGATSLPLYNFTQLVEHDGSSNATFQQRYQLDTSHFRAGGPILFFQGAENVPGLEATPLDHFDFYDHAVELGGIAIAIEHRFFGTSFPPGFDGSAPSYVPLTLENVLADSVALAEWVRGNVTGAEKSPVFIEGGSYGGILAATAKLKHPDTFYGAFASAGPVRSFGPWLNNTARFEIYDWTSNIYYDLSSTAANSIKSAMSRLAVCSRNETCPSAFPDLHLCDPQPNVTQWRTIYTSLADLYKRIPQFSFPRPAVLPADAILTLVNLTLAATDNSPGAVLRAAIHVANWQTSPEALSGQCANWTSANATVSLGAARKGSWGWITCNYVMTNQYSIGAGNMLPSTELGTEVDGTGRVEICLVPEWAGHRANFTNEEWIDYYGFGDKQLAAAERLVFVNGQWDPIVGVSVVPGLVAGADRNRARSIIVDGLAHTGDMQGQSITPRGQRLNLDRIRDTKREYIREWTAAYQPNIKDGQDVLKYVQL